MASMFNIGDKERIRVVAIFATLVFFIAIIGYQVTIMTSSVLAGLGVACFCVILAKWINGRSSRRAWREWEKLFSSLSIDGNDISSEGMTEGMGAIGGHPFLMRLGVTDEGLVLQNIHAPIAQFVGLSWNDVISVRLCRYVYSAGEQESAEIFIQFADAVKILVPWDEKYNALIPSSVALSI